MSAESQPLKENERKPTCPDCKAIMEHAIVKMKFPRGELPCVGFRCSSCSMEILSAEEVGNAQQLAEKLGLYEPDFPLTRTITKSGNQLAIYIPKVFV